MPHAAKKLLVVDDNEVDLALMARLVRRAFPGAQVHTSGRPRDVADLCREHAYDCVMTDHNMSGMDGLTLIRRLRADDRFIPLILMTGFGDEMLATAALRGGASDYIPKARINAHSLRRALGHAMHLALQARLIEEQRAELENFAYALAHDFKQPIRQITTFSILISEALRAGDAPDVHQHLEFLAGAAGRLGRLVDVMSQYTLLNRPPKLGNVDMNQVLSSIRTSLTPYLAERNGELAARADAPMIRGNETLMIQILQNLIVNGFHYNESESPRVEVSWRFDADAWSFEVRDNGLGIEEKYLSKIFNPLVRLHNASEYAGTGLGLTLARKAVLAQQGEIWCESTLGVGSTFVVRVPDARGAKARRSTLVDQAVAG
jgi:signal transduction histidine kinase